MMGWTRRLRLGGMAAAVPLASRSARSVPRVWKSLHPA
jgi:hypothetical protein